MRKIFNSLIIIAFGLFQFSLFATEYEVYDIESTSRDAVFTFVGNPDSLTLDCDSFLHGLTDNSTGEFFYLSERECYELFFDLKDYLNADEKMCISLDYEAKTWDYWKAYQGCL